MENLSGKFFHYRNRAFLCAQQRSKKEFRMAPRQAFDLTKQPDIIITIQILLTKEKLILDSAIGEESCKKFV